MVLRSVIGALVAVGVMGAIAAALPERHGGGPPLPAGTPSPATPTYGSLAAPKAPPPAPASVSDPVLDAQNRQRALLTLASVAADAALVAPQPVATKPAAAAVVVPSPAAEVRAQPSQTADLAPPVTQPESAKPTAAPPAAAVKPAAAPERTDGRININKASIAELDRIPGGGRIGAWIARRRPYRSIDDLVKKRVLREAAFQRIRSSITVD